jgi:hypothetical protein
MTKELLARGIMVLCTTLSFWFPWWVPVLVAPVSFGLANAILSPRDRVWDIGKKLILDFITYISIISYLVLCLFQFVRNMTGWYSWLFGLAAFVVLSILPGSLFPRRWHFELMER